MIADPTGQGPCDQRRESCLGGENIFGPKVTNTKLPPTKVDMDHGQQFYITTLQP